VLDFIPSGRGSDFGLDVLPNLLAANKALYGYRMTEDFWWIDSPQTSSAPSANLKPEVPLSGTRYVLVDSASTAPESLSRNRTFSPRR
jgi:hypothetical protein